jgi:hypothetical protein
MPILGCSPMGGTLIRDGAMPIYLPSFDYFNDRKTAKK